MPDDADTKACPFCGETIKAVAVRCKHCHAELSAAAAPAPAPDFDRGAVKLSPAEFEQRFLDFAYKSTVTLNAPSVAYALKIPIAEADERLEDLAARDVLVRDVDDEGTVFYRLPGRAQGGAAHASGASSGALVKTASPSVLVPAAREGQQAITPGASPQAMAGLLLNLVLPGLGSLVAGKTVEGVIQLVLILIGLPLCFFLIGIPICIATWGWALSTGIRVLNERSA